MDLRERVVAAVGGGMPRAEVARVFGGSRATIVRYLGRRRATGGLAPSRRPGMASVKLAALRAGLVPQLEACPDATLAEHCRRWAERGGAAVSEATMSRAIAALGWTRKKR